MKHQSVEEIREAVRKSYGRIAAEGRTGCGCGPSCGEAAGPSLEQQATKMGYTADEIAAAPEGANLGLGCGNPHVIASLEPGETVVDLGAGAGFDCFLAARQVGESGHVIGVDMTPEMIVRARENARKGGVSNVSFRLGEIEHLPVADEVADVVISNCVINLSPEKPGVFREAFRVLRHGGRLAVSDMIAAVPLPEEVRDDVEAYAGCVSGAASTAEIESMLTDAGFVDVRIRPNDSSRERVTESAPDDVVASHVVSALIEARKP